MKNRKLHILTYLLAIGSLLIAAILYPSLPDEIPTNWSFNGTVSYSGKITIFHICGMGILIAILMDLLPKIDPRRKNYLKFNKYYDIFCVFLQVFLLMMNLMILTESYRPGTLSVPTITMISIGLLLLIIGNMMPKFKSNFYFGIKTPWTLSSEEVWYKTHRLGGKCFFLIGLFLIICPLLPLKPTLIYTLTLLSLLPACLIPTIMSYLWWRQEQKSSQN